MPDSFPHRIIPSNMCRTNTVVSPDDEADNCPKHVEIDKYKHSKTLHLVVIMDNVIERWTFNRTQNVTNTILSRC